MSQLEDQLAPVVADLLALNRNTLESISASGLTCLHSFAVTGERSAEGIDVRAFNAMSDSVCCPGLWKVKYLTLRHDPKASDPPDTALASSPLIELFKSDIMPHLDFDSLTHVDCSESLLRTVLKHRFNDSHHIESFQVEVCLNFGSVFESLYVLIRLCLLSTTPMWW